MPIWKDFVVDVLVTGSFVLLPWLLILLGAAFLPPRYHSHIHWRHGR